MLAHFSLEVISVHFLKAYESFLDLGLLHTGNLFLMQDFVDTVFRGDAVQKLNIMQISLRAVTVTYILNYHVFLLLYFNVTQDYCDQPRAPSPLLVTDYHNMVVLILGLRSSTCSFPPSCWISQSF